MKKIITLLLFISNYSFAQTGSQSPTQFDKFIIQPNIEWAAYLNDTLRFTKNNLSDILQKRFDKGEIKGSNPIAFGTGDVNKIVFVTKKKIDQEDPLAIVDSAGNINFEKNETVKVADSFTYNLVDLAQIYFIENGKPRSYIPWVAPKKMMISVSGTLIGLGNYFSTAFNYNYNFNPSPADKVITLEQTTKELWVDSIHQKNMLKQLYGKNIIETLWPYVMKNKVDAFSAKTGKKLSANDINVTLIGMDKISVPVYDSIGSLMGSKTIVEDISPSVFKKIEVKQNWYYDQTKNVVFSSIPYIVLFAKKIKDGVYEEEFRPILKIVFK